MLKVGITGNIAAGKSLVEKILREKSFIVLDTDDIAHKLLKDRDVITEIVAAFPGLDIFERSEISRLKLGRIVFNSSTHRKKLENILHPLIIDEIEMFFERMEKQGAKVAFVAVPLLYEAGLENLFDKIVLIYADDNIRLERLVNRNNLTKENAKNRLNIQMSQDEKIHLVNFVIFNNKTLKELQQEIDALIHLL